MSYADFVFVIKHPGMSREVVVQTIAEQCREMQMDIHALDVNDDDAQYVAVDGIKALWHVIAQSKQLLTAYRGPDEQFQFLIRFFVEADYDISIDRFFDILMRKLDNERLEISDAHFPGGAQ